MPKAPKAKVGETKKVLHPNSRKAQQLSRKVFREMKINKKKNVRTKLDLLAEKTEWFKDNLDKEKPAYNKEELSELTNRYLQRFEEELEQIDIASSIGSRQGNQHASRKAAIGLTKESEKNEVESCGIEVPDLVNKATLNGVKEWNGEMKYLQNFKLKKICQTDIEKVQLGTHRVEDDISNEDNSEMSPS